MRGCGQGEGEWNDTCQTHQNCGHTAARGHIQGTLALRLWKPGLGLPARSSETLSEPLLNPFLLFLVLTLILSSLSLSLSHTHRHTHVLSLYSQQWLLGSISGSTFPEECPSALRGKRWGGVEREEREKRWGQEREAGRQASGTGRRIRLKRKKKKKGEPR